MNTKIYSLLETNLNTMYFQAKEWIEEIEFYEIEFNFLNSLISERINSTTTEDLDHKNLFRNMDMLLYKLSDEVLMQLKEHRKKVAHLLDAADLANNNQCVEEHTRLFVKIEQIKLGIKNLKKALFKYLKKHPFTFDFDGLLKDL